MQSFHQIDPLMKYKRGTLNALKTKPENLTTVSLNKRNDYLEQQPAIAAIYDFKQELHQIFNKKHCTAKELRQLIPRFLEMVKELRQSPFEHLRTLGNTLFKWRDEIGRMLRFTKNNWEDGQIMILFCAMRTYLVTIYSRLQKECLTGFRHRHLGSPVIHTNRFLFTTKQRIDSSVTAFLPHPCGARFARPKNYAALRALRCVFCRTSSGSNPSGLILFLASLYIWLR